MLAMRTRRTTYLVAILLALAPVHGLADTTIDFEDAFRGVLSGNANEQNPLGGVPRPAVDVPFVAKGVRFTAVPVSGLAHRNPEALEQSQVLGLRICNLPTSQNRVLGTGPLDSPFPIRAEFTDGVSVTSVSVEILACVVSPEAANLSLYDAQGTLLASGTGTVPGCVQRVTATSSQPVAYAIMDVPGGVCFQCAGEPRCTSFWIDNFTFETAAGP